MVDWGTCPGEYNARLKLVSDEEAGTQAQCSSFPTSFEVVDGANLVPQSPRRGVRGTIYNVLTFNLQGPITLVDEPRILHWHVFGAGGAYNP